MPSCKLGRPTASAVALPSSILQLNRPVPASTGGCPYGFVKGSGGFAGLGSLLGSGRELVAGEVVVAGAEHGVDDVAAAAGKA
jgi:hypothetical protein